MIDRFLIEEEKFYILLCSSKEALTSINIFKKYNKEQNKIAAAVISPEFTELERIKEHYEMSVNVIRLYINCIFQEYVRLKNGCRSVC